MLVGPSMRFTPNINRIFHSRVARSRLVLVWYSTETVTFTLLEFPALTANQFHHQENRVTWSSLLSRRGQEINFSVNEIVVPILSILKSFTYTATPHPYWVPAVPSASIAAPQHSPAVPKSSCRQRLERPCPNDWPTSKNSLILYIDQETDVHVVIRRNKFRTKFTKSI